MKYSRSINNYDLWQNYCKSNGVLIEELNLPEWVFTSENNFRQFATFGRLSQTEDQKISFDQFDDVIFFKLFEFMQNYFEIDASLFDDFERARIKRKEN